MGRWLIYAFSDTMTVLMKRRRSDQGIAPYAGELPQSRRQAAATAPSMREPKGERLIDVSLDTMTVLVRRRRSDQGIAPYTGKLPQSQRQAAATAPSMREPKGEHRGARSFGSAQDDDISNRLKVPETNTEKAVLEWGSDRDQTGSGTLIKLRFLVKEEAAAESTAIGIAELQAGNFREESVLFELAAGTVEIVPHTAGDTNGDGEVDILDLIRLRKYLVGAEAKIVEGNTDVNADTAVDILDLVRMRKYFAQQDVILE